MEKATRVSENDTPAISNLLNEKTQTLFHLQQDLIKKVVPTVVQILKHTIAQDLLFLKGMKNSWKISVETHNTEAIRKALQ